MTDHLIYSNLTAHSPGFAFDLSPELTLLIPTAGDADSQRQRAGCHGLHTGRAAAREAPSHTETAEWAGAQIQQGDETAGGKTR